MKVMGWIAAHYAPANESWQKIRSSHPAANREPLNALRRAGRRYTYQRFLDSPLGELRIFCQLPFAAA